MSRRTETQQAAGWCSAADAAHVTKRVPTQPDRVPEAQREMRRRRRAIEAMREERERQAAVREVWE